MEKIIVQKTGQNPQNESPAAVCDECGGEIYENDLAHLIDGFAICPDCFFDFIFDYYSDRHMTGGEIKEAQRHGDA